MSEEFFCVRKNLCQKNFFLKHLKLVSRAVLGTILANLKPVEIGDAPTLFFFFNLREVSGEKI